MLINKASAPIDRDAVFAGLPAQAVACCNWPEAFPARPAVSFKVFHDGFNLYLRYTVEEQCTAAVTTEDNGPVWLDSCVEFFIAPDDNGYYNFELNCIGSLLMSYRDSAGGVFPADETVLRTVLRETSLPHRPLPECHVPRWSAVLTIPATALFRHGLQTWDNVHARVNFYKCGDNLSTPHFLSWAPIDSPAPNFHLPRFFGEADFHQ